MDWCTNLDNAPQDGVPFLVFGGMWVGEINGAEPYSHPMIVMTSGRMYCVVGTDAYAAWVENPTHWMPLPDLPTTPT